MSRINALTDRLLEKMLNRGSAEAGVNTPTACGSWYCVACACPGGATGCRECRICNGVRQCQSGCNC